VGFEYGDLETMLTRYSPQTLRYGNNRVDGEKVFFISDPGLGLWAYRSKIIGARRMIVVLISDGAAQARPKRPQVLASTVKRVFTETGVPPGSETILSAGEKSRMATSNRRPASRRK